MKTKETVMQGKPYAGNPHVRFSKIISSVVAACAAAIAAAETLPLEEGFHSPPRSAAPHTLYHLMNGNATKEGITCDFEALAKAGIGGVQVFDVGCYIPPGPLVFNTPEWFDLMKHIHEEGKRLGLEVSLRDCSGWSNSGGPWNTPDKGMKWIVAKSVRPKGAARFHGRLPREEKDNGWYEDIRVLAFPTPKPGAKLTHFNDKTGRSRTRQPLYRALGNHRPDFLDDPIPPNDRREHPVRDTEEFPPEMVVAKDRIVDLTSRMAADGTLDWDVPSGDWTILRIGAICNGRRNHPASKNGCGLEVDKLSASAMEHHFNSYSARLCDALGVTRETVGPFGFNTMHIDSYEVGGQNWTQGLDAIFERRTGYSLVPFLPVFAKRIVGSVAETEEFLEDFRRVIADLFAENYAGTMARLCHARGLKFSLEPYGICVTDDLQYGQDADTPIAEFWSNAMLGDHGVGGTGNSRHAAYLAHVWGRRRVGAEAFTAHPRNGGCWATTPFSIKGQTDRAYAAGINCIFYHRFVHQPWPGGKYLPGMTMGRWGMHLDRTQTWWHIAPEFFTYQTRCQWMLQEGQYAADLLYWCGEAAPNFGLGCMKPPDGYAWDVCATKPLEMLKVRNGKVVVPGGVEYELLVLPQGKISGKIRQRIAELKAQGARIVDPAKETPGEALRRCGIAPDFVCATPEVSWIHRRGEGCDWYFVACDNATNVSFEASFRIAGKVPEIWDAETGEMREVAQWRVEGGRTVVGLDFPPSGSAFVVFRRGGGSTGKMPVVPVAGPSTGKMPVVPVAGSWKVEFPVDWYTGGTNVKTVTWAELKDWTTDDDPDVKYFSGTATYRVSCPLSRVTSGGRVILDLGEVKNFAEVKVNGKSYPPLWRPPFRIDITDAVANTGTTGILPVDIEIRVTNLWPNRLIGDDRLFDDDCEWTPHPRGKTVVEYGLKKIPQWVEKGERSPTGRHTFTTWKHWTKKDELLPSGLFGPVSIEVLQPPKPSHLALEKSGVRAEFDGAGRLVSLVNKNTGHEWCGGGYLWRMYIDRRLTPPGTPFAQVREEREIPILAEGQSPRVEMRDGKIRIEYETLSCRGETLPIRLEHSIVREFHCPLVARCSPPKDAELLVTQLGGMRFKDPVKKIAKPGKAMPYMGPDQAFRQFDVAKTLTFKYPAHTVANCYALLNGEEGLYFGSHDPTFQDTICILRCWPDENGVFDRLECGLAKYPNAQFGETLYTPADVNGRIAKAGDAAMLDTLLCFGWWRRGMDNGYPDSYFEAEPEWGGDAGWKKAIADYRAAGRNFILYFNGKLIDGELYEMSRSREQF